jgi:hypothetical protein
LPAVRVTGREIPLTTNSALVLLADEIVTEDPLAVRVPDNALLDPVATLPKFSVPGANANCPAAVPLPDSAIFIWLFEALDEMSKCPEAAPAELAVKTTPKVKLCPAPRFAGSVSSVTAKAALDGLACEMFTLVVPVFVRVAVRVRDCPVNRLPKSKAEGKAEIWPAAATPAPVKDTVAVLLWIRLRPAAVALTEIEPLTFPTDAGTKLTFRATLFPAARVNGKVSP